MAEFINKQVVLFGHCDPAGIVFYPRYFEMLNACVEAWCFERLGYSFAKMHGADGKGLPCVTLDTEFVAPSFHGDVLHFKLVPKKLGRTSINLEVRAYCDGALRVIFKPKLVFFSKDTGKSEMMPETMAVKIKADLEEY